MFEFLSLQTEMFACPTTTQFDPSLKLLKKAMGGGGGIGGGLEILETRLRNRDPNCKVM